MVKAPAAAITNYKLQSIEMLKLKLTRIARKKGYTIDRLFISNVLTDEGQTTTASCSPPLIGSSQFLGLGKTWQSDTNLLTESRLG